MYPSYALTYPFLLLSSLLCVAGLPTDVSLRKRERLESSQLYPCITHDRAGSNVWTFPLHVDSGYISVTFAGGGKEWCEYLVLNHPVWGTGPIARTLRTGPGPLIASTYQTPYMKKNQKLDGGIYKSREWLVLNHDVALLERHPLGSLLRLGNRIRQLAISGEIYDTMANFLPEIIHAHGIPHPKGRHIPMEELLDPLNWEFSVDGKSVFLVVKGDGRASWFQTHLTVSDEDVEMFTSRTSSWEGRRAIFADAWPSTALECDSAARKLHESFGDESPRSHSDNHPLSTSCELVYPPERDDWISERHKTNVHKNIIGSEQDKGKGKATAETDLERFQKDEEKIYGIKPTTNSLGKTGHFTKEDFMSSDEDDTNGDDYE